MDSKPSQILALWAAENKNITSIKHKKSDRGKKKQAAERKREI